VSFDVSQVGLNNVNDLLNAASPVGTDGTAYFVVSDHPCEDCTPQLLAATAQTPEPSTYGFVFAALAAIVFAYQRKNKLAQATK
jgi:hypothetical protein